jgi:hypothetical protein
MKSTLVKITPIGHDPEFMVVTTESSAHEFIKSYAKDNGYRIEERACANRFQCILQDLKRIEETLEKYAPVVLKLPALDGGEPYNDHLSQCFWNIETACDEEASEVEHEWLASGELPTFGEYTKNMTLEQMMEMYYDIDIWEAGDNADWLPDFEKKFKEYLIEREYIRDDS